MKALRKADDVERTSLEALERLGHRQRVLEVRIKSRTAGA